VSYVERSVETETCCLEYYSGSVLHDCRGNSIGTSYMGTDSL
jgi:hypothetical protein